MRSGERAVNALGVGVMNIHREDEGANGACVHFADEREEILVADDEGENVEAIRHRQVVCFQREPDVDAFFLGRHDGLVHRIVMAHDSGVHQQLIEIAVGFQGVGGLGGLEGKTTAEEMGLDHLHHVTLGAFVFGDALADEFVNACETQIGFAIVIMLIIIANPNEERSVVETCYPKHPRRV